jgi:2-hydroxychromene-2-carboxylate isomerase
LGSFWQAAAPCGQNGARLSASLFNLADPATIAKLADEAGLPGKKLVERSASEEISAAYEQNRQDAIAADVFSSPVYVLEGEVFRGQDRIELLADALKSGRKAYSSKVEA